MTPTRVRCPECKTIRPQPSIRYVCEGCGRTLTWQPPVLLTPEQLPLFGHGRSELPLTVPTSATGSGADGAATPASPDWTQRDLLVSSIAMVTALLDKGLDQSLLVEGLLADRPPDYYTGMAATTAWLMAELIQQFEPVAPGVGQAWLQNLAVGAQEM